MFVGPVLITFLLTHLFEYIFRIVIFGIPFIVFCGGICFTGLPLWSKILILIGYVVFIPYIIYFENWIGSGYNMFEVAFDVTWSEEYEKQRKIFYSKYRDIIAEYRDITDKEMKKENEKFMLNSENNVEKNN